MDHPLVSNAIGIGFVHIYAFCLVVFYHFFMPGIVKVKLVVVGGEYPDLT